MEVIMLFDLSSVQTMKNGKVALYRNKQGLFRVERPKYGDNIFISKLIRGRFIQVSHIHVKMSYQN